VYTSNHPTRRRSSVSVRSLLDYAVVQSTSKATFAYAPELVEEELRRELQDIDVLLAGPPCEGHSNLNNSTRRADPRNELYLTVPAFAAAVRARTCVIENVPAVLNDAYSVVDTATQLLESEGYRVTSGMLSAAEVGWPQSRKRHFLVARRQGEPIDLAVIRALLRDEPRSVWWAIESLEDHVDQDPVSQVTAVSDRNQERIDWLFDNDEYDLELLERPDCHKAGTSYMAVYGRLKKDEPAPTITTGFMSPGRGRYTHPTRRRVLTAREAARLQGFPDTYRFVCDPSAPPARNELAKWIGDAVPMPLGYAACLSALGDGL
jgi:DNA (cytosine-5)-methyltransferase 1